MQRCFLTNGTFYQFESIFCAVTSTEFGAKIKYQQNAFKSPCGKGWLSEVGTSR